MKELSTYEIEMTKGYAIITMLLLHLFCVVGEDVIVPPLVYITEDKPLIYCLGWLSAICAPTFCLCNGYAHYRQGENNGLTYTKCKKRLLKFMIVFWIACTFTAIVGLIFGSHSIPGTLYDYIANMLLVSWSYTGIWWYAFVYVFFVFISSRVYRNIKKGSAVVIVSLVFLQFVVVEILWKNPPEVFKSNEVLFLIFTRMYYLLGARLLCYVAGMYIAKWRVIYKLDKYLSRIGVLKNLYIIIFLIATAILMVILNKGILLIPYAIPVFIAFNLLKKSNYVCRMFHYLGKHSTYIWLVHPVIYSGVIPELRACLERLRYPIFVFTALLGICIAISCMLSKVSDRVIRYFIKKES